MEQRTLHRAETILNTHAPKEIHATNGIHQNVDSTSLGTVETEINVHGIILHLEQQVPTLITSVLEAHLRQDL